MSLTLDKPSSYPSPETFEHPDKSTDTGAIKTQRSTRRALPTLWVFEALKDIGLRIVIELAVTDMRR
jgi:hypothetical protein